MTHSSLAIAACVNGDPVNLVDPSGHDPWYEDEPSYTGPEVTHPTPGEGGVDLYPISKGAYVAPDCEAACTRSLANAIGLNPQMALLAPAAPSSGQTAYEQFLEWWSTYVKGGVVEPGAAPIPASAILGSTLFIADVGLVTKGLFDYLGTDPSGLSWAQPSRGPPIRFALSKGSFLDDFAEAVHGRTFSELGLPASPDSFLPAFLNYVGASSSTDYYVNVRDVLAGSKRIGGTQDVNELRTLVAQSTDDAVSYLANAASLGFEKADMLYRQQHGGLDIEVTTFELGVLNQRSDLWSHLHFYNWNPGDGGAPSELPNLFDNRGRSSAGQPGL